ncbi:MAG: hydroxymethylglutaryl-CoA lyase [Dehalococcoidia bacterium]|nr:hydroxymethylglutaryl-CoA lyase [Dehalococcoidia bacterium]
MKLPERVILCEQGSRDGIQMAPKFIPTDRKIELIDALSETGMPFLEVTSLVSARMVPQLRDAEEVMVRIRRRPGSRYVVIVPNASGARRAVQAHADEIGIFLSASETHNQHNVNMSIGDSIRGLADIISIARDANIPVYGAIATVFGCPYEGDVPPERVSWVMDQLLGMGCYRVVLGDTTGMANPRQVEEIMAYLVGRFPEAPISLHFHDNRGMGLANILASLQVGVNRFDCSVGGLGGSPTPGAMGNVCSEDLVHMLHELGVETGVDLDKLMACARLAGELTGKSLPSHVLKAGKRDELICS